MRPQIWGLFPKFVLYSVTCFFCLTILTSFALFVLLGLGVVEMSDMAISTLGGITIAFITLMRIVVKLAGKVMLHGS